MTTQSALQPGDRARITDDQGMTDLWLYARREPGFIEATSAWSEYVYVRWIWDDEYGKHDWSCWLKGSQLTKEDA